MQQVATSNKEELTRETTVKANPAMVSVGEALKKRRRKNLVQRRKKDFLIGSLERSTDWGKPRSMVSLDVIECFPF